MRGIRILLAGFCLFVVAVALVAQAWAPRPPLLRVFPFEVVKGLYYFTDRGNFRLARGGEPARFDESISEGQVVDFGPRLVFTFDDVRFGPDLDRLLDLLRERRVKAVFFLTENHMGSTSRVVIKRQLERLLAEGHELGNHSANHPDLDAPLFARPGSSATRESFSRLESLVDQILGRHYPMRWIRPPFGVRGNDGRGIGQRMSLPGRVDRMCQETGQNIILWHINSLDFLLFEPEGSKNRLTVPQVIQASLERIQASKGGVVLFHANQLTPAVIRGVLDGLQSQKIRQWQFATIAELLQIKYGGTDYRRSECSR